MNTLTIDNWKEYIPFQGPSDQGIDKTIVYFVVASNNPETKIQLSIIKQEVTDHPYTEDELVTAIKETLATFPKMICTTDIQLEKVKVEIARQSKRGMGNTECDNAIWYKGTSVYDSPLTVSSCNDKYALLKNPNFETYGFVVKE